MKTWNQFLGEAHKHIWEATEHSVQCPKCGTKFDPTQQTQQEQGAFTFKDLTDFVTEKKWPMRSRDDFWTNAKILGFNPASLSALAPTVAKIAELYQQMMVKIQEGKTSEAGIPKHQIYELIKDSNTAVLGNLFTSYNFPPGKEAGEALSLSGSTSRAVAEAFNGDVEPLKALIKTLQSISRQWARMKA